MKKQVNIIFAFFLAISNLTAQVSLHKDLSVIGYSNPSEYIIGGITVSGTKYLDHKTLISISGLEVGNKIIFNFLLAIIY